jgi:predicted transcriptional regulator of viral defense system
MAKSHKEAFRKLYEVADSQQGFFTTKQALAAGYAENTHPYHVQAGNWVREYRGIYRLAQFPQQERSDLVLWSLWSRNRHGDVQGAYSHQTALGLYDLSDLMPAKLHMTVPRVFRRSSNIPRVLVLHYADIPKSDTESVQGVQSTRPLRTLVDLLKEGDVSKDFIQQAAREAIQRGLLTRAEIQKAKISNDQKVTLLRWAAKAA